MEIWIVDDVAEIRTLFEVQLQALEPGIWKVRTFALAAEAIASLQSHHPSCAVVDRLLPGEDATPLLVQLQAKHIPVWSWTGEEKQVLQSQADFKAWWTRFRSLVIPIP